MKIDIKQKLDEFTYADLIRLVSWIVALASVVIVSVLGIYIHQFASTGMSNEQAVWGQFGDFVGGTVNPILGFLTLIALALTITLQGRQLSISSRELDLSRRELELTREELSRSALAQELSEKALKAQAASAEQSVRLATINFLLEYYEVELDKMHGRALNDPQKEQFKNFVSRKQLLITKLETLYRGVAAENNA